MLYLVTGTPGAGKTLNTIKFVNESPQFQAVGEGKPRDIFYHGIKNLSGDFPWTELTDDQAREWYSLPSGSVIIFDEAYELFPVRHGAKQVPEHVKRLATHRHHGYDIIMICQKVNGQLDPFVRGLVGEHHHYQRIFGSKTVNRFTWFACQDNPNSSSARSNANIKPARLDKKYFAAYHSADEHTHRMNLPWGRMIITVVSISLAVGLVMWVFARFDSRIEALDAEVTNATGPASAGATPGSYISREGRPDQQMTFADKFKPEIANIPWSAPVYAGQIEPQSWPRPAACILRKKSGNCSCYTQQATRLDVTREFCLAVVHEGFYDWTRPDFARVAYVDRHISQGEGVGEGLPTPTDAFPLDATAFPSRSRAILIGHTEPPQESRIK